MFVQNTYIRGAWNNIRVWINIWNSNKHTHTQEDKKKELNCTAFELKLFDKWMSSVSSPELAYHNRLLFSLLFCFFSSLCGIIWKQPLCEYLYNRPAMTKYSVWVRRKDMGFCGLGFYTVAWNANLHWIWEYICAVCLILLALCAQ